MSGERDFEDGQQHRLGGVWFDASQRIVQVDPLLGNLVRVAVDVLACRLYRHTPETGAGHGFDESSSSWRAGQAIHDTEPVRGDGKVEVRRRRNDDDSRLFMLRTKRSNHPHPTVVAAADRNDRDIGSQAARFAERITRARHCANVTFRGKPTGEQTPSVAVIVGDQNLR